MKTWQDLREHELIVAAVGAASGTTKEAYLLRNLFGFKFRVIMGYPAGGDVDLAMERGEVEGRANLAWQGLKNRDLKHVQEGRIRMLFQMGLARHVELPDLPLVMDFARNDRERQILTLNFGVNEVGYSFVAPPDVPAEQLDNAAHRLQAHHGRSEIHRRGAEAAARRELHSARAAAVDLRWPVRHLAGADRRVAAADAADRAGGEGAHRDRQGDAGQRWREWYFV